MMLMPIDRLFLGFMTFCGLVLAGLHLFFPSSVQFGIPPYFWVLIPMAVFEIIAFVRGRGAPGSVITIWTRLSGFVIATALMMLVPYLAGQPMVQIF
jgi:hypothetical protein